MAGGEDGLPLADFVDAENVSFPETTGKHCPPLAPQYSCPMAASALPVLLHEFRLEANEAAVLKPLIGGASGVQQAQQATAKASDLVDALQDGPRTAEAVRTIVEGLVATKTIRVEDDQLRLCPDFCRMVEQLAKHRAIAPV